MLIDVLTQQGLSNRESEVAALVATGLSNKEVADRLFVTEKTVKFHLTNIYKKMNIRSRTQLIVWSLPHLHFAANNPNPAEATAPAIAPEPINSAAPAAGASSAINSPDRRIAAPAQQDVVPIQSNSAGNIEDEAPSLIPGNFNVNSGYGPGMGPGGTAFGA